MSFVMEARPRRLSPSEECAAGPCGETSGCERIAGARFGFTVTKKIGNAIKRNRIRRRLREAVRTTAPVCARAGCDYVLIARQGALTQQFAHLIEDLKTAFQRIHNILDGTPTRRGRRPRRGAQAKPKLG